jgi:hypothetical protein
VTPLTNLPSLSSLTSTNESSSRSVAFDSQVQVTVIPDITPRSSRSEISSSPRAHSSSISSYNSNWPRARSVAENVNIVTLIEAAEEENSKLESQMNEMRKFFNSILESQTNTLELLQSKQFSSINNKENNNQDIKIENEKDQSKDQTIENDNLVREENNKEENNVGKLDGENDLVNEGVEKISQENIEENKIEEKGDEEKNTEREEVNNTEEVTKTEREAEKTKIEVEKRLENDKKNQEEVFEEIIELVKGFHTQLEEKRKELLLSYPDYVIQ